MNILFVNEFVEYSGAEQICKNQMELFASNNNVVNCLCFQVGKASKVNPNYKIIHTSQYTKFIFDVAFYRKIRIYLKKINPDIIIAHNIVSSPVTVYTSFRGFRVIQIVHDGKIICPTAWLMKPITKEMCLGCHGEKCLKNCRAACSSSLRLLLSRLIVSESEKARKKHISCFITPSHYLNNLIKKYGYNSICINNPIAGRENFKKKLSLNKKFVYAGVLAPYKGVSNFCEKLEKLGLKIDIDFYGSYTRDAETLKLINYLRCNNNYSFKGQVSHDELMQLLYDYQFVIVPSLWMENYPTIILEAMLAGTVVIGSNRGGIPELLENGRGLIFNPLSEESIENTLKDACSMTLEDYQKYEIKAFEFVKENNSIEIYKRKLENVINNIIGKDED